MKKFTYQTTEIEVNSHWEMCSKIRYYVFAELNRDLVVCDLVRDIATEVVNKQGKIGKRAIKVVEKHLAYKLTDLQRSGVANIVNEYLRMTSTEEITVELDIKTGQFIADMSEGEWGDSGSCFYGYYSAARAQMAAEHDRFGVVVGTINGRRGRCWINFGNGSEYQALIFNGYGSFDGRLAQIAKLLIESGFYPDCRVYMQSSVNQASSGYFYVNSQRGLYIIPKDVVINSDYYFRPDFSARRHYARIESTHTCECCGDSMSEEDAYPTNDGLVCEHCYNEHYFTCSHCGETHHTDNAQWLNDEVYCENCISDVAGECCHCGELTHNDNLYENEHDYDQYCENCWQHRQVYCEHCDTAHCASDCTELTDDTFICDDCIEYICDECGEYHVDTVWNQYEMRNECPDCCSTTYCDDCGKTFPKGENCDCENWRQ